MTLSTLSPFYAFLYMIAPILALVIASILILVLESFPQTHLPKIKISIALTGVLAALMLSVYMSSQSDLLAPLSSGPQPAWLSGFFKSYILDKITTSFYAAIGVMTFLSLIFLYSYFYAFAEIGQIILLTLFVVIGMLLLTSAQSFLIIFLAIELLSLPTYVLVGARHKSKESVEAALKYFLFGSLASVLMLFAIAAIYGETGSLFLSDVSLYFQKLRTAPNSNPSTLALLGMGLWIVAAGFKIGLVPFHMWVPDTYEGAPAPLTGFMGSAVKITGFALFLRLFWQAFGALDFLWIPVLDFLAILTMFVGNIAALKQDNLKRMLAFSSVAHAGYLLLAVSSADPLKQTALSALYYYLVVYGLLFIGLFAIVGLIEKATQHRSELFYLSGMGFSHPLLAFSLAVLAIAAAGIPPTAGFFAKYFVFFEAVKQGKTLWVVFAALSSAIGIYYYLRIIVYLYMKECKMHLGIPMTHPLARWTIYLCALAMGLLALFPNCLSFLI